uniref:R13L1/DRL21-like LRR repeat region domain-containing protein n=1 Tax=Arundo donax TaxID=35708 RepID=A0A0A9CQ91_ARUDO
MLFGEHHGSFAKTSGVLFEKATALRTIYLSGASYNVEGMLCNFSKLVHLRYIRIKSENMEGKCLLTALSRLYHLEVIDLQKWKGCSGSTRDISNLVKLRHFLVPRDGLQLHSNIVEVGKLKLLSELRSFETGKEIKGFELSQLGQLSELGGSLSIHNLEKVRAKEEAGEAKLIHKYLLHKLTLEWDVNQCDRDPAREESVLEILRPHSNLLELCIKGHGGGTCPSWLGVNLSVRNLESLHLDGVAWKVFPPIGDLWLVNGQGEQLSRDISDKKFRNLRRLELVKLPRLKKWVGDGPCQLFPHLKVLVIKDCSELIELSLSHSTCCQQGKEANISWFPRLQELKVEDCSKLLSFPPIPWTQSPCSTNIRGVGSAFEELVCEKNYKSEYSLQIEAKDTKDSTFWNVLAFHNLIELKQLKMKRCPPLPLHQFKMLSSLKALDIYDSSNVFMLAEEESSAQHQFPIVERIFIYGCSVGGKELTQLLTHFPKLSELHVDKCEKIAGLGVVGQQATTTLAQSSSANKVEEARIEQHQQQDTRGGEEIAASEAEGLLLLPSKLQALMISFCPELSLCFNPREDDKETGRTGGGGGLQGLSSLRWLRISYCRKFLSSYSSSSSSFCFLFPDSLEDLFLQGMEGMETLLPVSNLSCEVSQGYPYGAVGI